MGHSIRISSLISKGSVLVQNTTAITLRSNSLQLSVGRKLKLCTADCDSFLPCFKTKASDQL